MTPAMQKILTVGVVLVPLAFLLGAWHAHGPFSEQVAAWAQAMGGAAAVVAAFTIASSSARESRARDERQALSLISAAYSAAIEAKAVVITLASFLEATTAADRSISETDLLAMFDDALDSINAVPKHLLDQPSAATALSFVRIHLQQMRRIILRIVNVDRDSVEFDPLRLENVQYALRRMSDHIQVIFSFLPTEMSPILKEYVPVGDVENTAEQ